MKTKTQEITTNNTTDTIEKIKLLLNQREFFTADPLFDDPPNKTTIHGRYLLTVYTEAAKPKFYECGICGCFHKLEFNKDCRVDNQRYALDQLDAKYGPLGWETAAPPE